MVILELIIIKLSKDHQMECSFCNFLKKHLNRHGNPILGAGDVVVLCNCGLHHARHVEGVLCEMLLQNGVTLLYQPPYCPELNPCEYCFAHMKGSLKNNERFTSLFTELAIVNALELIKPAFCAAFFETCGYVR